MWFNQGTFHHHICQEEKEETFWKTAVTIEEYSYCLHYGEITLVVEKEKPTFKVRKFYFF